MRKLAPALLVLAFVVFGCAAEEEPALEPPDATAEATAGSDEINDHGTQTFTDAKFATDLELDDFYFEPTFIKSPGGATATITLRNEGDAAHTFTSDALSVDEELEPGDKKKVKVEIGTETRYEFWCRFHRAQGMRGAFQPH